MDISKRLGELERSAAAAGLPATGRTRAGVAVLTERNAYLLRRCLVSLTPIDRTDNVRAEISNQAGELLSELNARERFGKAEVSARPGTRAAPRPQLGALRDEYLRRFEACKPARSLSVHWRGICNHPALQDAVRETSEWVSIPWHFIAIIHGLEASLILRSPSQWRSPADRAHAQYQQSTRRLVAAVGLGVERTDALYIRVGLWGKKDRDSRTRFIAGKPTTDLGIGRDPSRRPTSGAFQISIHPGNSWRMEDTTPRPSRSSAGPP